MSSFGFPAAAGGEEGGAAAAAAGGAPPPQTAAEAALRHCLQQPKTQRWAAAEFCCSALDRPFFMFNPLGEGQGCSTRLWTAVWRQSIGDLLLCSQQQTGSWCRVLACLGLQPVLPQHWLPANSSPLSCCSRPADDAGPGGGCAADSQGVEPAARQPG